MKTILNKSTAPVELAALPVGVRARLCEAAPGTRISTRLGDLGFVPGTSLEIVRRSPLGDPVEIAIRGYRLCLRLEQIEGLRAVPEPGGEAP